MPPKVTSATTGPNTATEALEWTKEAINGGRYRPTKHLAERIVERGMTLDDVLTALQKGHRAEAYPDLAQRGGSAWRIFGRDPRGHQLAVGIEAYLDDEARLAILCTVYRCDAKEARMREFKCDCGGVLRPELLKDVDLKLYFGLSAVVREVPGEKCDKCGWSTLTGQVITALRHQLVAMVLELPDRLPPKHLYFLRVYLGLTQAELAKRMGITRKTVNQWEAKAKPGISPQNDYILRTLAYAKLAEALQPPRPTVLDHVRTTAAKRVAPLVVPGLRAA